MPDKHIELVEAVNNARSEEEHRLAHARLDGFRQGLLSCGIHPNLIACDLHYLDQGIERPMCAGVFLDWTPTPED